MTTILTKITDRLLGRQRLTLWEHERALVWNKGRFDTILGAGEHVLPREWIDWTVYDLDAPRFISKDEDALLRTRPDLVEAHLTVVEAASAEVKVVSRNGLAFDLVKPNERRLYWSDAGDWTVETVSLDGSHEVDSDLALRLMQARLTDTLRSVEVGDGTVGILSIDGVVTRTLEPGTYWFWQLTRKHLVRLIDTRWQHHDVSGQEVLTADRVTVRVNLTATYRVSDPLVALRTVKDFAEALHLSLQFAFRKTLGALTLDALLADKVTVSDEAAGHVRTEMAKIGLEVSEIALKDVILPGEMREILNRVVTAEKEAEANVIRRREETNATRSLLNTAKVMAENPVMLRLKELEALETIAAKVDRLTVHNGTEGLMTDIAKLRD
ncbi:SPFH domain-containing protein [Aestuariibius sp. 2305UL40-4]|uniref:SPFH domain-containing protein n=1 Tax=Aestuariibius violaceus TaxID=3234132 RepID=UPI00345EBC49